MSAYADDGHPRPSYDGHRAPARAASHPDFHRRSWSSTRSTGHCHC